MTDDAVQPMTAGTRARVVGLVARAEIRRRRLALTMLGVVVVLVASTVVAGLMAARRSASSVERFDRRTAASDVSFQSEGPETAAALAEAAGTVHPIDVASYRLVNVFPADAAIPDLALHTDPHGAVGATIDRPLVVEGRRPRAGAPEEILLNEVAARVSGLRVGDHLRVATWSATDLDQLTGSAFPGFNGPTLDLHVVGIGRTTEDISGDLRRTAPFAVASPALLGAHPDLGAWPPSVVVRLAHGSDDLPAARAAAARVQRPSPDSAPGETGPGGAYSPDKSADDTYRVPARRAADTLAIALVVFAVAAAVAGGAVVASAVNRQLAAAAATHEALRALGLDRRTAVAARVAAPALACLIGTLVGAGLAVPLAPHLLFGVARRASPGTGPWSDPAVGLAGAAAVGAVLLAACWWSGHLTGPAPAGGPAPTLSGARSLRSRRPAFGRPPVSAGASMAAPSRRGRSVPVRAAVGGLVVGILGVAAAGAVVTSLDALQRQPARWGWGWSSMPDYFGDEDLSAVAERLAADHRVEGVAMLEELSMVVDDRPVDGYALADVRGHPELSVLEGRLPEAPDEVSLGAKTMRTLHVHLGDHVKALTSDGSSTSELRVVGQVVLPSVSAGTHDRGAVVAPATAERVAVGDAPSPSLVLRYPPGADRAGLERALAADYGLSFGLFTRPNKPAAVRSLTDTRGIALTLAGFFAVLGLAALVHAVVVACRRTGTLAVLRMLGFVRGQVIATAVVLSLLLVLAGLVVGLPVGLAAGRFAWRVMVWHLGAVATPVTPWTVIVAVPLAAAALGVVAAGWPGVRAARADLAGRLRTE